MTGQVPWIIGGAVPDASSEKDWRFDDSQIVGFRPITSAESFDYSGWLDAVQSQIGQSCVGHALSSAAYLIARVAGTPIERPSPVFPWAVARMKARPRQALLDVGCSFRDAYDGLREYGLVPDDVFPETADSLTEVPPLDAFQEADGARVDAFYRIESGPGASSRLIEALRRGYCPTFAMTVDEQFANVGDGLYDAEPSDDELSGGHGMVVVGYSAILDAFKVLNSWGTTFGVDGFAWVRRSYFERPLSLTPRMKRLVGAFDIWVMQVAPEVR